MILEVEKIRKINNKTYLYAKGIPNIIEADLPFLPKGTLLEKTGSIYEVVNSSKGIRNYKQISQKLKFYYYTRNFLNYSQFNYFYQLKKESCATLYETNPYWLCQEVDEFNEQIISFLSIAKNITPSTFEERLSEIQNIIIYELNKNELQGHTWISYGELKKNVLSTLKYINHPLEIKGLSKSIDIFSAYLNSIDDSIVYFDKSNLNSEMPIFLTRTYNNEKAVFSFIDNNLTGNNIFPKASLTPITSISEEQNEAINNILTDKSPISILSGGPGTGKTTTIIDLVLRIKNAYPESNIYLTATTGKASDRLSKLGLNLPTSTIYKLLSYYSKDKSKTEVIFKTANLIIIDEASMLEYIILWELSKYFDKSHCKIVLVGDINQLPSVSCGYLFRDLIQKKIPIYYLTQNFRSNIDIYNNSQKINNNRSDLDISDKFEIITDFNEHNIMSIICDLDADIVIAAYKNNKNQYSTKHINKILQKKYNPDGIQCDTTNFRIGDRIIVNHNGQEKEVEYFNGETGTIIDFDEETYIFTIKTDENIEKYIPYYYLLLGYSITTHKSQGSEYNKIVIVCPEYSPFLSKRLFYTSITRAKEKVILITKPNVIEKIVNNDLELNRRSLLTLNY